MKETKGWQIAGMCLLLLVIGGEFGYEIRKGMESDSTQLSVYSPTTCYIVETGYTRIVADKYKKNFWGPEGCISFSLEGKEIGVLCGNVDILNIPPSQCQKMVKELQEPSLPEEEKKG